MLDVLKPLLDSGMLTEETRNALNEAWEAKLNEARETIRTEIREEFANRYEHDKTVMVESLDRMVTETLSEEIAEFQQDKHALAEQRIAFLRESKEKGRKFEQFLISKLTEEIRELRTDRKAMKEHVNKLEQFVMRNLASEISEFAQDKRAVVETKVRLVAEARNQLASLKTKFVNRSSKAVQEAVTRQLRKELTQLREDVTIAKQNNFGRKIFEAFAGEFSTTQLNESAELRKLTGIIAAKDAELVETKKLAESKDLEAKKANGQVKLMESRRQHEKVLNELLSPLNKDKQSVMRDLLESVQTDKLRTTYDKYLPAVLNEQKVKTVAKQSLTESLTSVSGNKSTASTSDETNIIDMKRLAGLSKE